MSEAAFDRYDSNDGNFDRRSLNPLPPELIEYELLEHRTTAAELNRLSEAIGFSMALVNLGSVSGLWVQLNLYERKDSGKISQANGKKLRFRHTDTDDGGYQLEIQVIHYPNEDTEGQAYASLSCGYDANDEMRDYNEQIATDSMNGILNWQDLLSANYSYWNDTHENLLKKHISAWRQSL